MTKSYFNCTTLAVLLFVSLVGCASVPPEVAQLHQKEKEIIASLQKSHLAIVDRYIDKRIREFEHFYFEKYVPMYKANWHKVSQEKNKQPNDDKKDFPTLDKDMVAEYQKISAPLKKMRADLRKAITTKYRNVLTAHKAIGDWLSSVEKLTATQKQGINKLLGVLKPGLSLEKIDEVIDKAKKDLEQKIETLKPN